MASEWIFCLRSGRSWGSVSGPDAHRRSKGKVKGFSQVGNECIRTSVSAQSGPHRLERKPQQTSGAWPWALLTKVILEGGTYALVVPGPSQPLGTQPCCESEMVLAPASRFHGGHGVLSCQGTSLFAASSCGQNPGMRVQPLPPSVPLAEACGENTSAGAWQAPSGND